MSKKTYSISELAVQLNLPRTTINDWLKNFAPYLEYEMKGKRKEYNQNALNVLKNISRWKNDGKSASVIQRLLEENYGLTGEVASDNVSESVLSSSVAEKEENSGELMQVVHSDLEMLLANVEQLNEKRIKSTRKAAWLSAFFMLLILAGVGIGGYFIYLNILQMQHQNVSATQQYSRQLDDIQSENKQQLEELSKLGRLELDQLSADFDAKGKKFQTEITLQKDELKRAFAELKKSVARQREAEIIRLREAFAAEQKALLEKLIAREKELTTLQHELVELKKHTDSLKKQLADINTMLTQERAAKQRLEEECQALNKLLGTEEEVVQ